MRARLRKVHQPRVASTFFDATSDPRPDECLTHNRSYTLEILSVGQRVLICNTRGKTVAEKVSEKTVRVMSCQNNRTKWKKNSERHAQGLTIIKHENFVLTQGKLIYA